jgi:hypothetical protein
MWLHLGGWLSFTKDITKISYNDEKTWGELKWSFDKAQFFFHFDLSNSTFQKQVPFICNRLQAHEIRILKGQQV